MTIKAITDQLSSKLGKRVTNIWPHLKIFRLCWADYGLAMQLEQ